VSGTLANDRPFQRTVSKKVTAIIGDPCASVEGTSDGHVKNRTFHVQLESFRRCRARCPEPGSLAHIRFPNKTLTVGFVDDGATCHAVIESKS
jgi:hypothetical protein